MQIAPSVILIVELYIVIMFSHHGDLDQTLGEGRGSKFMEEAVSTGPAGLGLTSHASIIHGARRVRTTLRTHTAQHNSTQPNSFSASIKRCHQHDSPKPQPNNHKTHRDIHRGHPRGPAQQVLQTVPPKPIQGPRPPPPQAQ